MHITHVIIEHAYTIEMEHFDPRASLIYIRYRLFKVLQNAFLIVEVHVIQVMGSQR